MSERRGARIAGWALLALAGLAVAVALSLAASSLSTQPIGLSAEPLRAGDRLVPPDATTTTTATGERRGRGRGRGGERTATEPAPADTEPTVTATAPATTTEDSSGSGIDEPGDDHGGHAEPDADDD